MFFPSSTPPRYPYHPTHPTSFSLFSLSFKNKIHIKNKAKNKQTNQAPVPPPKKIPWSSTVFSFTPGYGAWPCLHKINIRSNTPL